MGTMQSDMHHLGVLSNDECWLILSRIAFSGRSEKQCEELEDIGKEIAKKCKGLPLAAKALGSLLRFKSTIEQWENVLDNEIWGFKEVELELFPHLVLSYNELHPSLKQCFSYLSVFPKDADLYVQEIIGFWLALGYLGADGSASELELRGQEYFENLSMRSLLQDFTKDFVDEHLLVSGKMHDIVHDFTRSLRKGISDGATEAICQVCRPSWISTIKEYRTLLILKEDCPMYICDCLKSLHVLQFVGMWSEFKMPKGVEKLIHLRYLHLEGCYNVTTRGLMAIFKLYNLKVLGICYTDLKMIPRAIGNLVRLRHLNLSGDDYLKELPETISDLHELRSLVLCGSPCGLPLGMHKLTNLKHLHVDSKIFIGEAVGQLTGLRRLDGEIKMEELKYLKKLNQLAGSLSLVIKLIGEGDVVDDAREAELNKKARLQELVICFYYGLHRNTIDDSFSEDMLVALRPHQNLASLEINGYGGSKLPDWIVSPLNHLRKIDFSNFIHLSQFPELGKLPCLKELIVVEMWILKYVGREFLGIRTTTEDVGSASNVCGFPKLEKLELDDCNEWEEWEDITIEEEQFTTISFFPCLKKFNLIGCNKLKALPHRLWRKVITSSKNLVIQFEESPNAAEDFKMNILAGLNPGFEFMIR